VIRSSVSPCFQPFEHLDSDELRRHAGIKIDEDGALPIPTRVRLGDDKRARLEPEVDP